jgi:HD superfamily phosphodiesterase
MEKLQRIIPVIISFIVGGGLAVLVTINATRIQANAAAESAEISTIVQRIDAYDKIIKDLNARSTSYMEMYSICLTEKEALRGEVVELREKVKVLESKIRKLEKNVADAY